MSCDSVLLKCVCSHRWTACAGLPPEGMAQAKPSPFHEMPYGP